MLLLDATNPRILIVSRVLLGICQLLPDSSPVEDAPFPTNISNRLENIYTLEKGLRRKVDSFTNEEKTFFVKTNRNEVYPETILIYRDKNGPSDQRSPRIVELSKR